MLQETVQFNCHEGWLSKTGSNNKGWRERYFVLSEGKLTYYKSEKKESAQGTIDLFECVSISKSSGKKGYGFDISVPGRVYNMSTEGEAELSCWLGAINTTLSIVKSIPPGSAVIAERTAVSRSSSSASHSGGFMSRRRTRKESSSGHDEGAADSKVASRKDDAELHSLLEAQVDALNKKVSELEEHLSTSKNNCSLLQQQLREARQAHTHEVSKVTEDMKHLAAQVSSLETSKSQLEMMNDSYKVQLTEKDDIIEGLHEEVRSLEEECNHAQHELEETQRQVDKDSEQVCVLEEEVSSLTQQLKQEQDKAAGRLEVSSELAAVKETTHQLQEELDKAKDKTRQLQAEKDKVVSDLISLRKSHRNIERKLSETEEGKLSVAHNERSPYSPRHSPIPQERQVSALADAEKRAELATRLLQEVQSERDSLKSQLHKLQPLANRNNGTNSCSLIPRPTRLGMRLSSSTGSPHNTRAMSPALLRAKTPPTTAPSTSSIASDSPPKKPRRPPDDVVKLYTDLCSM